MKTLFLSFSFHFRSRREILLLILLLYYSFTALAQKVSLPDSTENKFFVGIGINNTIYPIMGEDKHETINAIVPIVNAHFGYKLTKRATIQIGLGYGANEINGGSIAVSNGKFGDYYSYQYIQGIVTPITFRWTPFNPHKRLQLYTNASLAPIFGHMEARATETFDEDVNVLYDDKLYTFDMVATVGLTLNYRLNKRIDIYADGMLFYKNFYFNQRSNSIYEGKSVGVGLNYNFNLKREK